MGASLMIQGTASGVGKSTVTAGLCRLLARRGIRVAPFKALNTSDRLETLPDGRRMARSQAIAAAACGLAPRWEMNPAVLVPHEGGAEGIVRGQSVGPLAGQDAAALRLRFREAAEEAYGRLLAQADAVIVEGAGSPVELNLKADDYANMGFARQMGCPVLLVADISRGGVFASVYGTVALLEEEERALVKGVLINKFHGDTAYFGRGRELLEEITGKPVLGILPYTAIDIEDEDSVCEAAGPKTAESIRGRLTGGTYEAYLNEQLDALADHVERHIDVPRLLDILGFGRGTAGRRRCLFDG